MRAAFAASPEEHKIPLGTLPASVQLAEIRRCVCGLASSRERLPLVRTLAIGLFTAALLTPDNLRADPRMSGVDAAYIDWSVKNCGVTSTVKEHMMVEQANAKDPETFIGQYASESQSKRLTDALTTPSKREAECADIKARYGPLGTRITDLIKWERAATFADKPAGATKSGGTGRRRRVSE
jgi:hypothetical protein